MKTKMRVMYPSQDSSYTRGGETRKSDKYSGKKKIKYPGKRKVLTVK